MWQQKCLWQCQGRRGRLRQQHLTLERTLHGSSFGKQKKKSKQSKGWNESMSALWLFSPFPCSCCQSWVSLAGGRSCRAGQGPRSCSGAQVGSVSATAASGRGAWEQPGFLGSWIIFLSQNPGAEGRGRGAQVPAVCGCDSPPCSTANTPLICRDV